MQLPIELKMAIESQIEDIKHNDLKEISETITYKYKNESGRGRSLINKDYEAITYSVVRMPATYGAVYTALDYTLNLYNYKLLYGFVLFSSQIPLKLIHKRIFHL